MVWKGGGDVLSTASSELENNRVVSNNLKESSGRMLLDQYFLPSRGVSRRAGEESERKHVLAGLWATRVVESTGGERMSGTMSNIRRGEIIPLNQNVVSISPQANGWMVVDGHCIEIVSRAPLRPVSLPWSKSIRWRLDW